MDVTSTTRNTVSLDGWTLKGRAGHTCTFGRCRLAGRATVRIRTGEGRDTRTDLYQDRRRYVWNNDHGTATLRNVHGRFIDAESWAATVTATTAALTAGVTVTTAAVTPAADTTHRGRAAEHATRAARETTAPQARNGPARRRR